MIIGTICADGHARIAHKESTCPLCVALTEAAVLADKLNEQTRENQVLQLTLRTMTQ